MASSYHQLGMVAQGRGRLDEAEDWYRKSLAISEEIGDRPSMASSYHQLGMVAQGRGRLDEAEDWYRKSLAISEEIDDRSSAATSYVTLGLLAEARNHLDEALHWVIRCVTMFEDFPHPATDPGPQHLKRLTTALGLPALESSWKKITSRPLPSTVRGYVQQPDN
ncbi:hypothetical protein GCM10023074_31170 [Microbispora amethystogenes]